MSRLCSLYCVALQEIADVQESFAMVGAIHALNEHEMAQWCATVFGSLSDAEYNDQMEQLYEASSFSMSPFPLHNALLCLLPLMLLLMCNL